MKKILIVDDHSVVIAGVKPIIQDIIPKFEYFTASTKDEALAILRDHSDLDLIILDINMPNYSCERMIENCRLKSPHSKIMILSMNSEAMMAKRFYQLGVDAYVNKAVRDDQMKTAFVELLSNRKYFSPELLIQIASETFGHSVDHSNPFSQLSQREIEVMNYLFEGKTLQEIAQILSIHPSSIGTYKSRIFEKMQVSNLIELYKMYKLLS